MTGIARPWGAAALVLVLLLVLDVTGIILKSRKTSAEPAIEDVFLKEKPQFTADLGQLLSIVPPTDYVAPPPERHGPQYRTADWLRVQGGLAWTLQVMSSPDEEVVKEYLAKRADKEQFAYVAQRTEAGTEYVVLFGNYVTRELAMGEAETRDFSLPQGMPSPAKFVDYIPRVPVLEPQVDTPPPPRYGDVPEPVVTDPDAPVTDEALPGDAAAPVVPPAGQEGFDPFAVGQ